MTNLTAVCGCCVIGSQSIVYAKEVICSGLLLLCKCVSISHLVNRAFCNLKGHDVRIFPIFVVNTENESRFS